MQFQLGLIRQKKSQVRCWKLYLILSTPSLQIQVLTDLQKSRVSRQRVRKILNTYTGL